MSDPNFDKIYSSLVTMRKITELGKNRDWTMGIFDRNLPGMSYEQLLKEFFDEVNFYFTGGDSDIAFVVVEGKYYPSIYFLIHRKHDG